jgi:hypothetical protein
VEKEVIKEVIVEKEVIKEVIVEVEKIVEVPVEVIVEKIVEVPVEVIVEKFVELPVFQSESVDDDFDYVIKEENIIENEYVSPGMDTHEPPRPNRLSYIKPQS